MTVVRMLHGVDERLQDTYGLPVGHALREGAGGENVARQAGMLGLVEGNPRAPASLSEPGPSSGVRALCWHGWRFDVLNDAVELAEDERQRWTGCHVLGGIGDPADKERRLGVDDTAPLRHESAGVGEEYEGVAALDEAQALLVDVIDVAAPSGEPLTRQIRQDQIDVAIILCLLRAQPKMKEAAGTQLIRDDGVIDNIV
ncbi:MAG TPA: hypothetical protein VNA24_20725 [Hyalangium sp.]|nr:hypothetical protein [Hyalangium sp.]